MSVKNPYSGLTTSLATFAEGDRQARSYMAMSQQMAARKKLEQRSAHKGAAGVTGVSNPGAPAFDSSAYKGAEGVTGNVNFTPTGTNAPRTSRPNQPLGLGDNPETSGPSGMSGPVGPSLADIAQAAMDAKYASVEGRISQSNATNQNAFTDAQAKMREFYGKAAESRKEPYASGVSELQGNLANLGMDFSSTDLAKGWDKNERNLQENADLALANDQSWFEKMKTVNQDVYSQLLVELAQTKMAEQEIAASGGGGSGGGGGGGRGGGGRKKKSSSDENTLSGDIQADTNFLFDSPNTIAAIDSIVDPVERERQRQLYDTHGSADAVLKAISGTRSMAGAGTTIGRMTGGGVRASNKSGSTATRNTASIDSTGTRNRIATRNQQNAADRRLWRELSPRYGPQQTNSKINETSKNKSPNKKVPGNGQ